MTTDFNVPRYDADQWTLLHDAARARAQALRNEAIDGFWRGANELLSNGVSASHRAAIRLAARLRQHAKRREPRSMPCP